MTGNPGRFLCKGEGRGDFLQARPTVRLYKVSSCKSAGDLFQGLLVFERAWRFKFSSGNYSASPRIHCAVTRLASSSVLTWCSRNSFTKRSCITPWRLSALPLACSEPATISLMPSFWQANSDGPRDFKPSYSTVGCRRAPYTFNPSTYRLWGIELWRAFDG